MEIGDLVERRMDSTLWLVLDIYFKHSLLMSAKTGRRRWEHKDAWRNYETR